MRKIPVLILMLAFMAASTAFAAEDSPQLPTDPDRKGVSLIHLIESASQRLKKNFIVDPRLRGQATIYGIDPEKITYRELQAVLAVHGFAMIEEGGLIKIIPEASARQYAAPLGDRASSIGDDEYVTKTIDVAPLDATQLVPLLRPMMPQQAHLVGNSMTNTLIVVDRYVNVRRIEAIVRDLQKRPVVQASAKPAN